MVKKLSSRKALSRSYVWYVPLLAGLIIPVSGFALWRFSHPVFDEKTLRIAKKMGMEPRDFNDLETIAKTIDIKGEVTNAQWNRLLDLQHSTNYDVQKQALGICGQLRKSTHRNEVLTLARPYLTSQRLDMELAALHALRNLHAPDWRDEVLKRQDRPEDRMREAVRAMLKQKD